MKPAELLAEIRAFYTSHADPAFAARYMRYFKEGYDPYGLPAGLWERQKDAWLAEHRDALGLKGFLQLGDRLVKNGKYEEGSLAIFSVKSFAAEYTPEAFVQIGQWLDEGLRNWAHVDMLCGEVLSVFLRQKIVPVSAMADWRSSPSKWKRRAVPVSMVKLAKDPGKIPSLLRFINPMMIDEERVVHQGLGWFLREAWKVSPEEVEAFLYRWKEKAPRLIFQYATEKMPARSRKRFQRSKAGPSRTARRSTR